MAGQNPLMFQVGIERANKEYDKIKKEIEDLVKLGDSGITIKVKLEELGNLQDFIKALQLIGDDQGLKKLIQNVTILKSQLQDVEEQSKKAHKAMAETSKSNQDEKTKLKNADELEARLRRLQDAYSTLNQLRHTALSNSLPVGDIETRMRKILEFIQKVRELQRGDLSNKNLLSTATFDDKLIFGKVNSSEYFTSLKNEIKQLIELYDSLIKKKKDSDSVELRKGSITAEVNQVKVMTEAQKELKAAILDVINTRKIGKGLGLSTPNISKEYRETIQLYKELERHAQAGTYDESLINRLKEHLSLLRQINTAQKDANTNKKESGTASTINQETIATQKNTSAKNQNAAATQKLSIEEEQLTKSIQKGITAANHQSAVINDLKSMAQQYLGVWGAQSFLRNVIEIGGQLEMQRLSIGAILGDMAKANDLFDKIKSLAIKSPFGVVELDQMTKQLSAYGFEYKELFDMTKRLADISAATGTDVSRLALALGHVRSEAALSGYTLRQFSMANIPLAKKLSEQLSEIEGKFVSVADVRKRVRAKDIGYEEVLKVLKDLTDQGGMFFNAQEIMSESVKAKFKNLKDSMDIMYGEIAESSVGGGLKDLATLLTKLTRHWEELGAVILTVGGYWMTHKLAVIACNKAMVQGNLAMGAFSAKQLEAAAHTGNLTRAQLLQAVATKKLSVADAEAAGAVYLLSKAQLQHVANTGKVTSATNMASLATSKYTVSQLRLLATFRNTSWLSWTKYLTGAKVGLMGLATGAKAVGLAIGSMIRSFLPLLALSAVVELFVSWKRESDAFADAANNVGQSARQMMEDVNKAIRTAEKSGKPLDNTALRSSVNAMKEVLEQNEFYTEEQRKQVENAETLSKKYDILLAQLREMREEAQWMADSESLLKTILANTGKNINKGVIQNYNSQTGEYEYTESKSFGSKFFNNSLTENMDELNKHNSELNTAISLLSEYRDVMNTAIEKNKGFGLSLDGKSWQEQIKLIAESGHWDEFVASVENAGSRFNTTAENVKKASEKVRDDWDNIVKDDFEAIRLTLMEKFNLTEEGLDEFAKNNEKTVRWMVDGIVKTLSKLGAAEELLDSLKRKLLNLFNIDGGKKPTQKVPTEYDKQTDLGKRIVSNVIRNNKKNGKNGNGVTTVKEINQLTGTGDEEKTESEVIQSMKDNAQKALQRANDIKKIYGESSKKYKDANKEYERLLNIATSNGISEDEIKTGKYKDKTDKSSGEDKDAKRLREIARLYKDAYDWYNKYEKQVGKGSALEKVQKQFQPLFDEFSKQFGQTLSLDSIPEYRENLTALLDEAMKIYSDPKHQNSYMVQAIQNIRDAINNVDYEEAQRKMDEYASSVQIELDSLTRAWETFNSVRETTGDIELAIQLSGVEYEIGKTQNLADALKEKIQKDFNEAGGIGMLKFDSNLSDKQIKELVEKSAPKADTESLKKYEERIKGLVEEYKKWRDLLRDNHDKQRSTFAKLTADADALLAKMYAINSAFEENGIAIKEMYSRGEITQNQRNLAEWQNERVRSGSDSEIKTSRLLMEAEMTNAFREMGIILATPLRSILDELRNETNTSGFRSRPIEEQKKVYDDIAKLEQAINEFGSADLDGVRASITSYILAVSDERTAYRELIEAQNNKTIADEAYKNALKSGLEDTINAAAAERDLAQQRYNTALQSHASAQANVARTQSAANASLTKFTNGLSRFKSVVQGLTSKSAASLWDSIGPKAQQSVGMFLSGASKMNSSIKKMGELLKKNGSSIDDFQSKLGEALSQAISGSNKQNVMQNIQNSLSSMFADSFGEGKFDNVKKKVGDLIGGIVNDGLKQGKSIDDISNDVGSLVGNILKNIGSIGEQSGNIYGMIIGMVLQILDLLGDYETGIGALVGELIEGVLAAVGGIIKNIFSGNFFAELGTGIFEGIGSWFGYKSHDERLQEEIDALNANVKALEANTTVLKALRDRSLGYDKGQTMRDLANIYSQYNKSQKIKPFKIEVYQNTKYGAAGIAMSDFYGNNKGTGYQQEYNNLIKKREDYIKMYNAEADKKESSEEALAEYKSQIAELDEQILYFTEDLANELWGIDLKGWADQISDALWTAFENGEDAVKAFGDTAKQILAEVAKKMMNIHLIEPVMNSLEEELFGRIDSNGNRVGGAAYNANTGEWNEEATLRILGRFFGEDGEFAKVVSSAEQFYKMAERITGFDFSSDGNTSMSGGIKGVTEQTADLIASYLNAIRADVSVNRAMIAQYFPLFLEAVTANSKGLTNIEQNVDAIMKSNQIIADKISDLDSRVEGLQTKKWKLL